MHFLSYFAFSPAPRAAPFLPFAAQLRPSSVALASFFRCARFLFHRTRFLLPSRSLPFSLRSLPFSPNSPPPFFSPQRAPPASTSRYLQKQKSCRYRQFISSSSFVSALSCRYRQLFSPYLTSPFTLILPTSAFFLQTPLARSFFLLPLHSAPAFPFSSTSRSPPCPTR